MHRENVLTHEEVLDRYAPLLFRVIWQSVGSTEKTESLARKVFVKLARTGQGDPDTLKTRLVREAVRRSSNRRAPAWQWRRSEDDWAQGERMEHTDLLRSAVGLLPPEYCYAIYFRHFEGCGDGEIGAILGCPPASVGRRLEKAEHMLEAFLHEAFDSAGIEAYRYALTASPVPSYAWRVQTLEAMERAEKRPYFGVFHSRLAAWSAVAAAGVLVVLGGAAGVRWWQGQNAYEPVVFPGGVLTEAPGFREDSNLPAIPRPGLETGYALVRDFNDQISQNPTRDHTEGLTHLPVYPARPTDEAALRPLAERMAAHLGTQVTETGWADGVLTARCGGGIALTVTGQAVEAVLPAPLALPKAATTLENQAPMLYQQLAPLAGLEHPVLEYTTQYDLGGAASRAVGWFEDSQGDLTGRLLDYTFRRVGDMAWAGRETSRFSLPLWPEEEGVLYPIRTAEEALAGLETENRVLHTEIVYWNRPGEAYLQPVYQFTVTNGDWDLSDYQDEDGNLADPNLLAVGFEYAPAVEEAYLEG